jgi:uncharacterized OB-fold protein
MEVEKYVYTPGLHGLEAAKALKEEGRFLGTKCGDTVYYPPTTYCPDFSEGELAEVRGPWRVAAFTVVRETMDGERLEKPVVIALVTPDDAVGGLYHYIDAEPDRVFIGMEVKPRLKPREKRTGNPVLDIEAFVPAEGEG